MEDRFNKEKSLELKGVAIIFMFWLHLYGQSYPEWKLLYGVMGGG